MIGDSCTSAPTVFELSLVIHKWCNNERDFVVIVTHGMPSMVFGPPNTQIGTLDLAVPRDAMTVHALEIALEYSRIDKDRLLHLRWRHSGLICFGVSDDKLSKKILRA